MDKLGSLNLPELQKKLKNNPQLAIGASAVVGLFGFAVLIKRLTSSNDDESHIPDFALPNDDREMTERLTNLRHRRQARRKQKKQKQKKKQNQTNNKSDSNSNDTNYCNDNNTHDESTNSNENSNNNNNSNNLNNENGGYNLNENDVNYNANDLNNGLSNNDDNQYSNENETNDDNNGNNIRGDEFSADKYYNPHLRIRKESIQRKPDAAFMALFGLYASNTDENSYSASGNTLNNGNYFSNQNLGYMTQSNHNEPPFPQNFQTSINDAPSTMSFESKEAQDDQYSDNASAYQNSINQSNNNNGIGINTMNAQNVATHNNNGNDIRFEVSNSPMTTPVNHNIPSVSALDRLKDLYAKNKLPPSLQPDSLSLSFQSNPKQAAIVNRSDDSLMSTIKKII